jgi:hypothetical protein
MVDPKNAGKLLSFPLSTPVPEGAARNWDLRFWRRGTIRSMRSTISEMNTMRCWRGRRLQPLMKSWPESKQF